MTRDETFLVHCEGWWEQGSYGRQSMEKLRLALHEGRIEGTGTDVVGPFTFAGTITAAGAVAMQKQYIAAHQVTYLGTYDGEGILAGEWRMGPDRGPWMIRLRRLEDDSETEIGEIVPRE